MDSKASQHKFFMVKIASEEIHLIAKKKLTIRMIYEEILWLASGSCGHEKIYNRPTTKRITFMLDTSL